MTYAVSAAALITAALYVFRRWDRNRETTNRELVLAAVKDLAPYAYGLSIRDWIEARAHRSISLGGVYAALEDLEDDGLIGSAEGPRKPARGNRRIVYFLPKSASDAH